MLLAVSALAGCSHFRAHNEDKYVYVIAKESYLRDRVAAVSNRTGEVTNGERLVVLERDRRFVKVKTPDGAVGWMEARLTADQDLANQFVTLGKDHLHDPVVAKATARDDVYLHIAPGRETDRFYRLAEGDTMSLLERASVAKPVSPGAAIAESEKAVISRAEKRAKGKGASAEAAAEPVLEDWWLVRDAKGQTGWVYSRLIDVNIPDALERYAEGQRIVGAYVLAHADDPDSGMINNGQTVTSIPEYVTVVAGWKTGLPYDFDEVRVFIWNVKKHRYETSLRERNFYGYLPVRVSMQTDPYGKTPDAAMKLPSFSFKVLAAGAPAPAPNPTTGLVVPAKTITKTYRLVGNICQRVIAPGVAPPEEAHPAAEVKKEKRRRR
ncbi:MAG TPA: SH3 domain-containing protein [Acidobacteriaceae bacterium]|nr:SH3 domain-containing protein [Acidobacteriaceae bacterium]